MCGEDGEGVHGFWLPPQSSIHPPSPGLSFGCTQQGLTVHPFRVR